MENHKGEKMGFHKLLDKLWEDEKDVCNLAFRLYSVHGIEHDTFVSNTKDKIEMIQWDGLSVKVSPLRLEKNCIKSTNTKILQEENGVPNIVFYNCDTEIPKGCYIMLSAPSSATEKGEGDKREIDRVLDLIVATVRMQLGANLAYELCWNGVVNVGTGNVFSYLDGISFPTPVMDPFLDNKQWLRLSDTLVSLNNIADIKIAGRLKLSLELCYQATELKHHLSFLHYWTAIERLCDTMRSVNIRDELARCYGLKETEIETDFGFKKIAQVRNDLVHSGVQQRLEPDAERYIQCMFLDLLRDKLGLSHEGYMKGCLEIKSLDLSVFGLPNYRLSS